MAKRYEKITLNGQPFTLDTKETVSRCIIGYRNIYDVYARPSTTKVAIWQWWEKWFNDHDGNLTIRSYNSNFFTIEGYVKDENGQLYYCLITHASNKCWKAEY